MLKPTQTLSLVFALLPITTHPSSTGTPRQVHASSRTPQAEQLMLAAFEYMYHYEYERRAISLYADRPIPTSLIRKLQSRGVKAVRGQGEYFVGTDVNTGYLFHAYIGRLKSTDRTHATVDAQIEYKRGLGADEVWALSAKLQLARVHGFWRVIDTKSGWTDLYGE